MAVAYIDMRYALYKRSSVSHEALSICTSCPVVPVSSVSSGWKRKLRKLIACFCCFLACYSTLKKEVMCSFETTRLRTVWHYSPLNRTRHSHRREEVDSNRIIVKVLKFRTLSCFLFKTTFRWLDSHRSQVKSLLTCSQSIQLVRVSGWNSCWNC